MKPTGGFLLYRPKPVSALVAVITALSIVACLGSSRRAFFASASQAQRFFLSATAGAEHDSVHASVSQALAWNTFLGGSGVEQATGVARDQSGNIYVTGPSSASWGSPVNAYRGSGIDVFAAKLDSSGNLIWNTFLNGNAFQGRSNIAVDNSGNVYVAYPTMNACCTSAVAKLDSNGNLVRNTPFFGGLLALALDGSANLYVAGSSTGSFGSPVRPFSGNQDAYVEKLDSNGMVVWNTFLGGVQLDASQSLAVDGSGHLYVTGSSNETWGSPVRPYSLGFSNRQQSFDAFAAKLDSASGNLIWNTFLGSAREEFARATALDGSGNVFVVGNGSATWGSPVHAFFPADQNAFAAKLNSSGQLVWNTFLGQRGLPSNASANINQVTTGQALAVDASGNAYVTGFSGGFFLTHCPYYPSYNDAYITKLDTTGHVTGNWLLGGNLNRLGEGLALDVSGNIYVVGESDATWGVPVRAFTTGSDAGNQQAASDGFIAKIPSSQVSTVVEFSLPTYSVNEGTPQATIGVKRSGDSSTSANVSFATTDTVCLQVCAVSNGQASSRCDYLADSNVLQFAPGEISKSVSISIVDDSFVEGDETFTVSLNSASGAFLGPQSVAPVRITDNDSVSGPNPINSASFFVLQHYFDFLNREPDSSGFAFWTNEIGSCGPNQQCLDVRRVNVSAAFYLSIEFQETGYLVERVYKAAFGDFTSSSQLGGSHSISVPTVGFTQLLRDAHEIGQGVVVNQGNWQQQLENNKQVYMAEFVQRPRFTFTFPTSLTPTQFVDLLFTHAGLPPSGSDHTAAINEFNSATTSADPGARARALRIAAENSAFVQQEFNRAFVLLQYFGYLRRSPNDSPDSDYTGYDFWLTKLNVFNGNFVNADMVKAFITSSEYKARFGP